MNTKLKFIFLTLFTFSICAIVHAEEDPSSGYMSLYIGPSGNLGQASKGFSFNFLSDFLVAESGNMKFMIGPGFNAGLLWHKPSKEPITQVDVSCSFRTKYRFRMVDHNLDLYLRAPVGFSIVRFNSYYSKIGYLARRDGSLGFHAGLMAGTQFSFYKQFGIFAELGFLHRSVFAASPNAKTMHLPEGSATLGLAIDL